MMDQIQLPLRPPRRRPSRRVAGGCCMCRASRSGRPPASGHTARFALETTALTRSVSLLTLAESSRDLTTTMLPVPSTQNLCRHNNNSLSLVEGRPACKGSTLMMSQGVAAERLVFMAGQIPLDPPTMQLIQGAHQCLHRTPYPGADAAAATCVLLLGLRTDFCVLH